jgi:hypothetical protein
MNESSYKGVNKGGLKNGPGHPKSSVLGNPLFLIVNICFSFSHKFGNALNAEKGQRGQHASFDYHLQIHNN